MKLQFAHLSIEYWKLLRSFERALESVTSERRPGLVAQVRYSSNRLEALLNECGMRLIAFDGVPFEVNLPAAAVNGDEFGPDENLFVERTIEPAVIWQMQIIVMGRAFLSRQLPQYGA
jgi:hypothetical protein